MTVMIFMETKNENFEICKKSGGYCCKKCGCDFIPKDFEELTTNYLLKN